MSRDLKAELKKAISKHYSTLKLQFPMEEFYGYSLYSSDDISSLGPVANRLSVIEEKTSDSDYFYYKYSADEWSDWDDFELFEEVNSIIAQFYNEKKDCFDEFRDYILNTSLQVMKELEQEGLFGLKNDERFLVIWISDSSDEIINISAKQLNTQKVYKEFASEFIE